MPQLITSIVESPHCGEDRYKRSVRTRTKLCKDDRIWKTKWDGFATNSLFDMSSRSHNLRDAGNAVNTFRQRTLEFWILGTQQRSKIMFQLRTPLVLDTRIMVREIRDISEYEQDLSRYT